VAKAEYEKKLEAYKKTDNFKKFEKKAKEQKQLAKKKKKKEKEESSEEESSPPPKTKKLKKKKVKVRVGAGPMITVEVTAMNSKFCLSI